MYTWQSYCRGDHWYNYIMMMPPFFFLDSLLCLPCALMKINKRNQTPSIALSFPWMELLNINRLCQRQGRAHVANPCLFPLPLEWNEFSCFFSLVFTGRTGWMFQFSVHAWMQSYAVCCVMYCRYSSFAHGLPRVVLAFCCCAEFFFMLLKFQSNSSSAMKSILLAEWQREEAVI